MQPLAGVRIVVTRAAHQAEELAGPLRALGANILLLPTIGIGPPENSAPVREAASNCNQYDWIIFTSVNAVEMFAAEMPQASHCGARVAAIGAATAQAAERCGFTVSLIPENYVGESLVEAFAEQDLHGRRILIPSAAVTRDVVPRELRKLGAHVEVVEAYRNVLPPETAQKAANIFREPYPDWVLFASSSAVENLLALTGPEPLQKVSIGTIGPVTSQTVIKSGLTVTTEATVHSIPGLVDAVIRHK
ncbi:MAG: uroporphyrinogen-III synthase [Bryobacteraceae bacterium]